MSSITIPHCPAPTTSLPLTPIHPASYQRKLTVNNILESKFLSMNVCVPELVNKIVDNTPKVFERTWVNLMNEVKAFNKYYEAGVSNSDFSNKHSECINNFYVYSYYDMKDFNGKGKWVSEKRYRCNTNLVKQCSLYKRLSVLSPGPDNIIWAPLKFNRKSLWTKKELNILAANQNIKGRSKMSKEELWRSIYGFNNNGVIKYDYSRDQPNLVSFPSVSWEDNYHYHYRT